MAKPLKIKKRKFSLIWLTPILALGITVWLLYNGYINSGKEIRIQFDSGADIVVGKTQLKYRGIPVGRVIDLEIADSMDKVNAVVKLDKKAESIAKEGMMFWIVKPRVSINQITGLETIMAGTYIEVKPPVKTVEELKNLKDEDFFIGLSEPAAADIPADSVMVSLHTDKDMGIYSGMPLYFNNISAGRILNTRYDENTRAYDIIASVNKDYGRYINGDTKFWNISGFELKLDSAGLSVELSQLNTLFQGGVAFDSAKRTERAQPLKSYEIFTDYTATLLSPESVQIVMPECYGMKEGRTPVMFKGVQAGIVEGLDIDGKQQCVASVKLDKRYGYLAAKHSRFVVEQTEVSAGGLKNLSASLLGVFLNVEAGSGEKTRIFRLSDTPIFQIPPDSFKFRITGAQAKEGAGVYFQGVRIGMVTAVKLHGRQAEYDAVIFPPYKKLAVSGICLWKPDMFSVSAGGEGLSVGGNLLESVQGGINAGFFGNASHSPLAAGTLLKLYGNETLARRAALTSQGSREIYLTAQSVFGLDAGAPVFYKGMRAGEIASADLSPDGVRIAAVIYPEYEKAVNGRAIFWKNGRADLSLGSGGLRVTTPSAAELLSGGLSFDIVPDAPVSKEYVVYESFADAEKAVRRITAGKTLRLMITDAAPPAEGTPVYFRGVKTGEVGEAGYDSGSDSAYVFVLIDKKYTDTVKPSTRFFRGGTMTVSAGRKGIKVSTEPAMNYVTGAVYYDTFASASAVKKLYADREEAQVPDYSAAYVVIGNAALKEGADVICDSTKVGYIDEITDGRAKLLIYNGYKKYFSDGAVFWVEDAKISADGVRNPDAVLFGAKLAMTKGSGQTRTEFSLSDRYSAMKGLHIVLRADTRHSLEEGSPVYYRQVQTGSVEWVRLSDDARQVEIGIFIDAKNAHLVRTNTVFSPVSGIEADYGIFKGVKIKTGTVKSIIKGGLEFKTDLSEGQPLKDGDVLELNK
ncbi:MlaD family protein [Seleniivibrio woodruffii]|uniref:MlaD family protein n=1 Tax=Seleniivibrio woodruffii TaxID=1078050 RepID=UPI0026F0EAC3|nr:MlaD family protein [Seleniivibrio woodruffii]